MKEAKFTPGPWTIDEVQIEDWRVNISSKYQNVAAAYHMTDSATDVDPECLANARLIAAAPDLLAALIRLEHVESGPHSETTRYLAREDARAAIAKALGED